MFEDRRFLTIEAAETLCMLCLPPEKHILRKKYLGVTDPSESHILQEFDHQICIFTDLLKTVK